ncbi:saccharopine dehydrogenase family protein [Helicobacter marmotae]|uniref:Saccharopine dehydrogenase n=1 Tax=Helicobacter marmotae TaxID=152490 RepID=A0A3D8I1I9_9HELI|nr:saccharopine dehydrogenase family protein [Helicobacter marmotae]RDU58999.1 saccharopine dehydrogenase [Helicobacter marmotae]
MDKKVVLQIGAGGVGGVVAHKMAMNRDVFGQIILASRTLSKCKAIADSIRAKGYGEIDIDYVNADSVEELVALIEKYRPHLVVNVALPYQDLSIMEACLRTRTHYLDTANYEHPDSAHFEYKEQWAYDTRYKQAGIFALLGSGFDPGVTNVFCAYAQKHYFDEIYSIDILDCNAGDHGYAFATNFNPEINLREVSSKARYWVSHSACSEACGSASDASLRRMSNTPHSLTSHNPQASSTILECGDSASKSQNADSKNLVSQRDLNLNPDLQEDTIYRKFEREERHWEQEVAEKERARLANLNDQADSAESLKSVKEATRYFGGEWRDIAPLALMKEWDYPEVGVKNSYLLYHEELESLIRNIKGLRKIRFFMTFGESYLTHMKCLENVGLLRVDSVAHKGGSIVPIEVLKTLLPDPASLAPRTKGKTNIGCYMHGIKDGKERTIYIYNVCEHEKCYEEVNAQGVSYTTGVPAMIGAKLICEGKWGVGAVKNSSLGYHCADFADFKGSQTTSLASPSKSAKNHTSAPANTRILESNENQDTHSLDSADSGVGFDVESFNAERLKLNADMPKGGEYQGIDNALELQKNHAEAVEMRNRGFGAGGEGSLANLNDQADSEQSAIYRSNATQGAGVWNMEQNDPDPFMQELNKQGLPYVVLEVESNGEIKVLEDGRK